MLILVPPNPFSSMARIDELTGRALPLILIEVRLIKYSSEGCKLFVTTVSEKGFIRSGV